MSETLTAPLWPDLLPRLQPWASDVRGQLIPNQSLAEMTTLRVGGPAQLFFRPLDEDDLAFFLKHLPRDIRLTVIGLGSNLLIREGGLDGVVIRLPAKGFGAIDILDGHRVRAGAAVPDVKVATAAAEAGIDDRRNFPVYTITRAYSQAHHGFPMLIYSALDHFAALAAGAPSPTWRNEPVVL